jgi:hypothetical protein
MTYDIHPFPSSRGTTVDAGYLAARRHIIYGLVEADVMHARELLKSTSGLDGRPFSFTAFVIASFARAIQAHPLVHAYRDLLNRIVVFHDVDVAFPIEAELGAAPIPRVIRAANSKPVKEISDEIRSAQAAPHPTGQLGHLVDLAPRLPRFVRLMFIR